MGTDGKTLKKKKNKKRFGLFRRVQKGRLADLGSLTPRGEEKWTYWG
jgi:hypothetical protein